MAYLIGTDEAGYGPNLGPLVVSATVWQVPDGAASGDLYRLLADVIVSTPGAARGNDLRMAMADSKALYQPGKGLRHLERGLLATLAVLDRRPDNWQEAWDALAPESAAERRAIPWYADYQGPLPLDADPRERPLLESAMRRVLATAGVRLVELRSRAVFPAQFNRLTEQHGSKGAALSHLTLGLLAKVIEPLDGRPISIVCDKHGGRNRYGRLLGEHFPEWLIEIHGGGRSRSVYRSGPADRRIEICFQPKAESHLPAALASMASKYLRELAMQALNAYWRSRIPTLRPTAGYPQDARRFRADIAAVQAALDIDDAVLWRTR